MLDILEIRQDLGQYILKSDDNISYTIRKAVEQWAINHFGRVPYLNQLTNKSYQPGWVSCDTYADNLPLYQEDCTEEELRERNQNIDYEKTLENILDAYHDTIVYHYRTGKLEDAILFNDEFVYSYGVFMMDTPTIPPKMIDCIVEKEYQPKIRWVLRNSRGSIENKYMEISPKGEIEGNYNDDFEPVNKKIQKLIHDDESSIIILHGKPGTGKTSYIRDLIDKNKDVKFFWIDSSMFNYIDTSEFIEFIASCKNCVFVLEDSESLLTSREEGRNPAMQSLLSISDGMLGDSLKLKFICTFNTDLKNIDEAILRKGRMKVKYEFKDLAKEKVKSIFKKIGVDESLAESMPLCDVYNYLEDNGNKKEKKKIGF